MDKKQLIAEAFNWIAEKDEEAKIIADGNVDEGSVFMAEFVQNLIESGALEIPNHENSGLHLPRVSKHSEL